MITNFKNKIVVHNGEVIPYEVSLVDSLRKKYKSRINIIRNLISEHNISHLYVLTSNTDSLDYSVPPGLDGTMILSLPNRLSDDDHRVLVHLIRDL